MLTATPHVCKTRMELLDQLAATIESLGRAKLDLKTCLESGVYGRTVKMEVDRLRDDCGKIKHALETHRASHGC